MAVSGTATNTVRRGALIALAGGAFAAAGISMALLFGSSVASASGMALSDPSYPEGTVAIADASTMDSYKTFPTGDQGTSYDSTQYAGRLWTDKTVTVPSEDGSTVGTTATFDLADPTRDLDEAKHTTTPGKYEVDKTASGIFLTSISALSSSLETQEVEPVPLDIVLVLDVSGSMAENGVETYLGYTQEQLDALTAGQSLPNPTYYRTKTGTYGTKLGFEGYAWVSESPDGADATRVPYINKWANGRNDLYILTADKSLIGTSADLYARFENPDTHVHTGDEYIQYNFGYTNLYHTKTIRYKIDELHDAASQFIATIAQNNSDVEAMGFGEEHMSRIGIVKFSGQYNNGNNQYVDPPVYKISDANNGKTEIMAPLKVYTTDGTTGTAASEIRSKVEGLEAKSATAADFALTLAGGVLEGRAYYTNASNPEPGARPGVQQVVVFFTDGNPKHNNGTAPHDFSGLIAQNTLAQAEVLKNAGVTIYSVAVLDGANSSDTTQNANIYLNGVSSNYPHASATSGVDNVGDNVYGTNYGRPSLAPQYYMPSNLSWTPDLGERAHSYVHTSDAAVVAGKTYYTRSGKGTSANPYVYTEVTNPTDANLGTYFELSNYYLTVDDPSALSDAFMKILNEITSNDAADTTATGRDGNTAITITDYLGDYMEFKGLDGILYGTTADTTKFYAPGTQGAYHEQAQVQRDDSSATQSTYTMWPRENVPSALLNPPEGQEYVSLNLITVKVTRSTDAKTGDTVTITIPPELIPSVRYAVTQQQGGGSDVVTTATRTEADPLRIFYSVGPKAGTLSNVISQLEDQSLRSESANNESDRQSAAFISFMEEAAAKGENGIFSLYSNDPMATPLASGGDQTHGRATVAMALSTSNPYYFYVDEPLFVRTGSGTDTDPYVYDEATSASDGLYVRMRYWSVGGNAVETNEYEPWSGSYGTYDANLYVHDETSGGYVVATEDPGGGTQLYTRFDVTGGSSIYSVYGGAFASYAPDTTTLYIPEGTPRVEDAVVSVALEKPEGNGGATGTATTSIVSTFAGGTTATQHLGNNGRLDIPVFGTLAVTKNITAGTGFDLPADPVPSASFTLSLKDADGVSLNSPNTYRALIRNAAGHPVDPDTHTVATSADSVKFYVVDGSTFTLRDGETLKVTNLPDGATYQVTEDGQAGYAATVTDNTGDQHTAERGESASTSPAGSGD